MAVGLGAIRLPPSPIDGEGPEDGVLPGIDIDLSGDTDPIDPKNATTIETADGGVIIHIGPARKPKGDAKFDDNLAETLSDHELGSIADQLILLIDQDEQSRSEWLETRARGIKLMGLKIEDMRSSGADGAAPLEGMSQVNATLLCEAVIRFGANAFAELCPTDGPAKVGEDSSSQTSQLDDLADALEKDLNHYLTVIDKPWVPDTDAALLRVGLDGCVFKKVYHDPILRRPVSRVVFGEDVIVNNSANSVYDAGRITHRMRHRKSTIKRMQIVGAWRKVNLGDPGYPQPTAPERQTEEVAGVRKSQSMDEDDREHEFLESYCELDLPGFEHEDDDGDPDGLPLPYKVTIHRESRQIVEIRRNYEEDDELCLPKTYFVQYAFIRGFGFYAVGLSHLLGNLTNGISAAWREFIDAGMFANFPGLIAAKGATRQNNSIFRVPPGGVTEMETGGLPIDKVVMGVPYKSPDAVFVGFIQQLESTGQRLGGTAEVMVGEGRQDAPVGTTLALIEQAIKPLMATHKRLCAAQSDELQLLVERFREDPQAFVRASKQAKPKTKANPQQPSGMTWDENLFLQAINENQIVTRADPNTASHLQRMLRNAALYQIAKDDPASFNVRRIRQICIRGIGFANPDQFLNDAPQGPPPDPKAQADQAKAQADIVKANADMMTAQMEAKNAGQEDQNRDQDRMAKLAIAKMGLQKQEMISQTQLRSADVKQQGEMASDQADRQHEAGMQARDHAQEQNLAGQQQQHDQALAQRDQMHEQNLAGQQRQHDLQQTAMGQQHEAGLHAADQQHEAEQTEVAQAHEAEQTALGQKHDDKQAGADRAAQQKLAKMKPKPAPAGGKK